MKQTLLQSFRLRAVMLVAMMCALFTGQTWAEEKTSTLTFTAACGGSGTADDGIAWTISSDGNESNFDNTKGIHYGTGSAQVEYIKLSTSGISGTITKVVVNASTASGVTATVDVTVGGSAFGGDPQSLTTSAANYTFTGSTSGEIVVTVKKPSKAAKALYVKSVAVTYSTAAEEASPLSSIAVDASEATTVFHVGDEFTHEGAVVTATYENESTKDVTADATFSAPDMRTAGNKTVTVSYTENEVEKTTYYFIEVKAPATLASLSLSGTYPTEFTQGATFSSEGIVVTANYDDGTTKDVTAEAAFSGYDMSATGEQTVTVSYENKTATYTITVNEYTQPTKFKINLNNTLFGTNYSGSVSGVTDDTPVTGSLNNVTVTYAGSGNHYVNDSQIRFYPNNKLKFEAPTGYKITEIVFTSAGNWAATISSDGGTYTSSTKSWEGEATTVLFTGSGSGRCDMSRAAITLVKDAPKVLSSIALSGVYATTFHVGDDFSSEGLTVTATYEDGKTADVTDYVSFTGYDMAATGTQTVTVSYTEGNVTKTATYDITVKAPATLTSISLSGKYPTEFGQGDAFSSEGIVVTANYDDETTKDVTSEASFSGYDMTAIGEQEVTVTYEEKTALYTINVVEKKGTEANPYTVAEARAAIDASTGVTGVYATGIVSEIVTPYSSQYGNITYNISTDGTTESDQLQAYRGKGKNGDNFTSEDDIQVGDVVVIYGNLKKYNSTYEFEQNNQLVSLERKELAEAGFSFGETTSFEVTLGETFAAPALTTADNFDGTVAYESSNTDVATVDNNGAVTLVGAGETTITASSEATDNFKAGSASYTLTVNDNRVEAGLAYETTEFTISLDDAFTAPALINPNSLTVTYASNNEEVATVDEDGNVTIHATGVATITASSEATDTYQAGSASYTITVKKAAIHYEGKYFAKVTSTDDLEDGAYLIVYETEAGSGLAFDGSLETLDASGNTKEVDIDPENGIANVGDIQDYIFVWDSEAGTLQSASGFYIGQTSDANGLASSEETAYTNTIAIDDEGNANIVSGGGAYLRYNSASNQARFRYYKSSSYSNQQAITLYHLTDKAPKAAADFSFGETNEFTANLREGFNAPTLTYAEGFDGTVTYESSNTEVATVDNDGTVTLVGAGETTITASSEATDNFKAGSASYTLTVVDPNEPVDICELNSITPTSLTIGDMGDFTLNATFVEGVVADNDYEITWTSSDPAILEVAGTTYEAKAAGEVTITVKVEVLDEDTYNNVEKTFEVTVEAPKTYVALVADLGNGTGMALSTIANGTTALNGVSVDIVNGKVVNGKADNISWEITEGKSSKIVKTTNGKYLVHGTASKNTDLKLSESSTGNEWVATLRGAFGAVLGRDQAIQWSTANSYFKNYAGSDNGYYAVSQYTFADGYTRPVTAGNWGTFCADHTIAANDYSGVKFYSIAGKTMNADDTPKSIALEEVTGELTAGVAYIFQANEDANKLVAAYSTESIEEPFAAKDNNGLVGSFEGTDVEEGMYLLSGGKVVKCGTGCSIVANRAYINMDAVSKLEENNVPAGVKMLYLEDTTTGINGINADLKDATIFNIAGQRVNAAQKGMYIVNGKKVIVK